MESENSALYDYLMKQTDKIAAKWLSQTKAEKESTAKQYHNFIHAVLNILTERKSTNDWKEAVGCTKEMAHDRAVNQISVIESIKGFKMFRSLLMDEIEAFSNGHEPGCSKRNILAWNRRLHLIIDEIVEQFIAEYDQTTTSQLKAQKEMIHELSAPVFPISTHIGVLPLIGEIDTHRARVIIESALGQCAELRLSHLFIDISGVPLVDTMVAYQLFKVVDSTKLLGIETIISGIGPEIAQTVVKLGIDFSHIKTEQSLAKALCNKGFCIREEDGLPENENKVGKSMI
ncbi:STAS domain-containing protein [Bacillus swezeyi]|uniref:STAS domain-containing protein n=1 Tax=Bacillus swezeyi TaxID=1925020 RepID=A0A5M8RVY5_9BACI|nr:STAS domain-containing protein [Bacillus swezeyi]KAA6451463.1 STAS domain-containing protein [Bacillus swezeyi]TYS35682.1 STAS domain-containing protein [Bacillus swezeyi]